MTTYTGYVGTAQNKDNSSGNSWSSPDNVKTGGLTYSSSSVNLLTATDFLTVSNFGFAVPEEETLTTVQLVITCYASKSGERLNFAVFANAPSGTGQLGSNSSVSLPTSLAAPSGSVTVSTTPAVVNDPNFGLRIWADPDATGYNIYVDLVVVYVSTPAVVPPASATAAWVQFIG